MSEWVPGANQSLVLQSSNIPNENLLLSPLVSSHQAARDKSNQVAFFVHLKVLLSLVL